VDDVLFEMGDDGVVTITINTNVKGERSASGKTQVLASTRGNQVVGVVKSGPHKGKSLTIGLNAYVK